VRWKFWANQLLSGGSLLTAGAAAAGLLGWATTHNPMFGWMLLGGGGAWTALMYYLVDRSKADLSMAPNRVDAVKEVEGQLQRFAVPTKRPERAAWTERETQLRRIAELERVIFHDLPKTSSGVSLLSAEQQLQVADVVDQAVDLSKRRVLLLRALTANSRPEAENDLRELLGQRSNAPDRVRPDLDELISLKREHVSRITRWEEDLRLTEINLEQIETFLRSVAYDHAVTPSNVSERIGRIQRRVEARRESVEEMERRINEAAG
jgi:hypothetical protein